MRPSTPATRSLLPLARAPRCLAATGVLLAAACARTILLSGGDLPPESRARLNAKGPVRITMIDGKETRGRRFELAPGPYTVRFAAKYDLGRTTPPLEGVIHRYDCEVGVEIPGGETVELSVDWNESYSRDGDTHEASFSPQFEVRHVLAATSETLSMDACDGIVDCRRARESLIWSDGCDRW